MRFGFCLSFKSFIAVRGRSRGAGSCGVAYFTQGNKVVAFHVASVNDADDDDDDDAISLRSHLPNSNGLVICRLPKLMQALKSLQYPISSQLVDYNRVKSAASSRGRKSNPQKPSTEVTRKSGRGNTKGHREG